MVSCCWQGLVLTARPHAASMASSCMYPSAESEQDNAEGCCWVSWGKVRELEVPGNTEWSQGSCAQAGSFHLLLISFMAAIKTDTSLTACNECQ